MLKNIFGSRNDDVTVDWRKVRTRSFMYQFFVIIRVRMTFLCENLTE